MSVPAVVRVAFEPATTFLSSSLAGHDLGVGGGVGGEIGLRKNSLVPAPVEDDDFLSPPVFRVSATTEDELSERTFVSDVVAYLVRGGSLEGAVDVVCPCRTTGENFRGFGGETCSCTEKPRCKLSIDP